MIAVITITVMIRSNGLGYASGYIGSMYGIHSNGFWDATATMLRARIRRFHRAFAAARVPGREHPPEKAAHSAGRV